MADEDLGHEAAGAEGAGQDVDDAGIGEEVREQGQGAAARLDEALEVVERGVRVGGLGEAAEELVEDVGEQAAGRRVLGDGLQVAVGGARIAKAVGPQQGLGAARGEVRGQQDVADVDRHRCPDYRRGGRDRGTRPLRARRFRTAPPSAGRPEADRRSLPPP